MSPEVAGVEVQPVRGARLLQARVDNRARICVRQNYYSVPARYPARRVAVRLSAISERMELRCPRDGGRASRGTVDLLNPFLQQFLSMPA
jgi:hypothetical protein